MIISHKYRFIFIKTAKTAGTSLEVFLGKHCGEDDIITPTYPLVEGHRPRNYKKTFWPFPEICSYGSSNRAITVERHYFKPSRVLKDCYKFRCYHEHMPARMVKWRIDPEIWNSYHKFAFERNPWDKTLSHYHMLRSRAGGNLTLEQYFERGDFPLNYPYYLDDHGALLVDEIIKYEDMKEGFGALCERFGIPFDGSLGVRAKGEYRSDRRPYTEVLTSEQADRITGAFRREIEMHGYQFGA